MAGTGRRAGTALIKRLLREPHRFDFFQAVRLLEWLQPQREPMGEGLAPGREAVRFRADPSLGFPASEVTGIAAPREPGDVPEVSVSFLGLTGANGPLPHPFTQMVMERAARKDRALGDFLDLFHHRLISIFFRIRRKVRIALHAGSPEESEVAERLYALIGLGTRGLRERTAHPDRALLRYAGLLAQRPRSMHGLTRILSDYFAVPVEGRPFVGRWVELEADQQTTLGAFGQNAVLGESAVLGSRVWDQQGRFEIVAGPLTLREYASFLPGSEGLARLVDITRFYVGPDLEFDVRLRLRPDEVPATRLGAAPGPRLGWTSWLRTGTFDAPAAITIHDPERIVAAARMSAADAGGTPSGVGTDDTGRHGFPITIPVGHDTSSATLSGAAPASNPPH